MGGGGIQRKKEGASWKKNWFFAGFKKKKLHFDTTLHFNYVSLLKIVILKLNLNYELNSKNLKFLKIFLKIFILIFDKNFSKFIEFWQFSINFK